MIALVAALIALATLALVVVLWWAGTAGLSGAELVNARLAALRTGLSIGVGGGGIFALYLAWRRQHATEIGLVQKERDQADVARAFELQRETAEHTRLHAERVAATTERDAEARRITDLYAKSVEQLGSDKAPVRHGGLYALERLAQDHPDNPALRQTVVNVICAYLRAPFDPPGEPPDIDAEKIAREEYREQVQEREVRLTAQTILTNHLRPGYDAEHPADTFWPDTDLDLTAATLIDLDLAQCRIRTARFAKATFTGGAVFHGAMFTDDAWFGGTTFSGDAEFLDAAFAEDAWFSDATFSGNAEFQRVVFNGDAWFDEATFTGQAEFFEAVFTGDAAFLATTFSGGVWFPRATFNRLAEFPAARFSGDARFHMARFVSDAHFSEAKFTGEAFFHGATFNGNAEFHMARFSGETQFGEAKFIGGIKFRGATFTANAELRCLLQHPLTGTSSWPSGWQPADDHGPIEGLEGTWHRLVRTEPGQEDTAV